MTDTFDYLKYLVENGKKGKDLLPQPELNEPCHQRLFNALVSVGTEHEATSLEIAVLIRHFLRREDEDMQGGTHQILKVPRYYPYPQKRTLWEQCGLGILQENQDSFLIDANPWTPNWLKYNESLEKDAFVEVERRNYAPVPGDNFLSLVGLTHYRSIGQREAIRAVLTAPIKSTTVINLPTGAGKSLCAQLPALLGSKQGGVSVVVVPTIALALDQERALSAYISHPTAYYGDTSEAGKQRRNEICQRIRQGTQRLVFTSPESLINSLCSCLYDAAKWGYLRYFVIDEVHIVEQWGEEFRPAFQEMIGLRKDLLRYCSFNTLLLTATLTESCLDTLEALFGQSGDFQVVSAVQLRPEPSYWFSKCENEQERRERLKEAIYHLPRPIIVYASKREDVYQWKEVLSLSGFRRFDVMTGDTPTDERSQLLQKWRDKSIDIVIATSAFGLGVDLPDIRSVIHICIPETVDRFYQEVGRGGRDGKASISLTLYTDNDYSIAKSLNERSSITLERGMQRWESMFSQKVRVAEGLYQVYLDVPPSMADKDIDMNSQQNRNWNSRTLTLISQAGLIDIDWKQPPQKQDFSSEADYEKAYASHQTSRTIRMKNEFHLKQETWENYVEPIRQHRQQQNSRNLDLMKEALWKNPRRCLSEIFQEAYTISARASTIPARDDKPTGRKGISVSGACGGCPWCRQQKRSAFAQIMPHPSPIWENCQLFLKDDLKRVIKDESLLLIFYEVFQSKRLGSLMQWFVRQGVNNLISPTPLDINFSTDSIVFLADEYQPIKLYRVPTLIYHPPSVPFHQRYLYVNGFNVPRIILLPSNTPDPERSDRSLIDVFNGRCFRFENFCKEISL